MRHRKSGIKLSRTASHRKAMFRNMVTSLFKNERIQTTDAKAKELRGWADHIITLAKRGDLHARRQALSIIREKDVVHKLFENAGKRFGSLSGGYTRVVKLGVRSGDAAPMSLIELVNPASAAPAKPKKKKTPKPAAKAKPAAEKKSKKAAEAPQTAETEPAPAKIEAPPQEGGGAEEEAEQAESTGAAEVAAEKARSDEPEDEKPSPDTDGAQTPEPEKEK